MKQVDRGRLSRLMEGCRDLRTMNGIIFFKDHIDIIIIYAF